MVSKALYLNLTFGFLNRISLLILSTYPIVLTMLRGPRSRSYTSRKISRVAYSRESNPGSLGWLSDMLTTIPNRRSVAGTKHHTTRITVCNDTQPHSGGKISCWRTSSNHEDKCVSGECGIFICFRLYQTKRYPPKTVIIS